MYSIIFSPTFHVISRKFELLFGQSMLECLVDAEDAVRAQLRNVKIPTIKWQRDVQS